MQLGTETKKMFENNHMSTVIRVLVRLHCKIKKPIFNLEKYNKQDDYNIQHNYPLWNYVESVLIDRY